MIIIEKILSEKCFFFFYYEKKNVDLQFTAGPLKSFWGRKRERQKKNTQTCIT